MMPTIQATGKQAKTITATAILAATLFVTSQMPQTFYAVGRTPFPAGVSQYISPLTTDIEEVLLDDTESFYLTWE